MRIESYIDSAGILVFIKNLLPGLAAIERAEDAPLRVGSIGMAECRDKRDIRIRWIDDDFANGSRIVQTDVLPRLAAVERLVHAVAVRDVSANAGLAGSDVKHVMI